MITAADIALIAPELASVSEARVAMFAQLAEVHLDYEGLGNYYTSAHLLLVSHLLTLSNRQGANGAVTSESVGEVSRSYASSSSSSPLSSTSYGQMFLDLMEQLPGKSSKPRTPIVV